MKTKSIPSMFVASLVLCGCAASAPQRPGAKGEVGAAAWPWSESMEAVNAAPKNHKVIYEDERVRILDVTVEPGEKENMHYHRWPSILIVDSPAKKKEYLTDGTATTIDRPPATAPLPIIVRMGPAKPHAIENLDDRPLHLYRIELKKIDFKE